ncbi:HAL/PAL/TAL family ammonia-lyase [Paraburkholderia caribensis]|uniref:HAL/PAL/TAL family ammonia-lyase n=1 Tax=Paraburkholderia caribensis TaxID=75105 RepID=UPI001CADE3FD|nr:aromatic amino acid ammonia-lyase [Paraburkholderia caribensis]CAG9242801.1 Putative Histidine ammonia-lyase; Putative Allantokinase [Paraburkholderia caribensis]
MVISIRHAVGVGALLFALTGHAAVSLDGKNATPEAIAEIANGASVSVPPSAIQRVTRGHDLLIEAAVQGQRIYGLTVGVGLNKDRQMVDASGNITPDVIEASMRFNAALLHAHSGATGPDMDVRTARAVMATRLNQILLGASGVQPAVEEKYLQFLNAGITPAIPTEGSVGEADITILSHVGLTMMGEGDVYYKGLKVSAAEAMKAEGITAIRPWGKDALGILSSNAYSTGMAALALVDLKQLSRVEKLVFALSLQGLNGNVSPFLNDTLALHPYPHVMATGAALRNLLAGSSLWQRDDDRALQDPLSFRDAPYLLAEVDKSGDEDRRLIQIQLNSSDDNPAVAVGVKPDSDLWQAKRSYLEGKGVYGAVLPSANFEPLPFVMSFEETGIALAQNSLASAQRIIKLNDPRFTHLNRFLGTDHTLHAFGAMEKPPIALAEANRELASPVSMNYFPAAGDIEDIATNAPQVIRRVQTEIDNSFDLFAIELISAAQAAELRKKSGREFMLSPDTKKLFDALRAVVPFRDEDRAFTPEFRAASAMLKHYQN